jgi:signal recognition particle subunit SRP54
MFEELTEKLERTFKNLRGQGKLSESNIRDAMRDIRRSLLEADVNFKVAKRFIASVEEKALGTEVHASITPGQLIVKIVHDELIALLGGEGSELRITGSPEIIMICGLQGSGKTTSAAKLARYLQKKGKRPFLSSADVYRPAARQQLKVLAKSLTIPFHDSENDSGPESIAHEALDGILRENADVLIMDTAGRLHIDEEMMDELSRMKSILHPQHVLFVADGMTGQDAVNAVGGFIRYLDIDGVILTKMDGDARGGAALSLCEVTGKPILFVGTGERVEAFEQFHPERFASRILGMGDVVSLVERAQEALDMKETMRMQEKILSDGLTLTDFLDQLRTLKKMGPLDQIVGMIPGVGKAMKGMDLDGAELKRAEAMILSMSAEERRKPHIIDGSRRKRIAAGSGTSIHEVNTLLKQFFMMQKMMKNVSKLGSARSLGKIKLPYGRA